MNYGNHTTKFDEIRNAGECSGYRRGIHQSFLGLTVTTQTNDIQIVNPNSRRYLANAFETRSEKCQYDIGIEQ